MRRLRRNGRFSSWLAVVALLGNALAMALPPRPAVAATAIDELLGAVVICTADGAKALAGGGGSAPVQQPSSDHCLACVTVAQAALAMIFTALLFLLLPAATPVPAWRRPSLYRLRPGGTCARAPPLFA
jgi:Protein of unknown function (DUF2946)